jgi:3-hydroxyisobutyrate dehydrogenase
MTSAMSRVGFIGLGNLGVHLAGSLLRAGHDVTVNDLNQSAAADLVARGATWADSVADVSRSSEVVFTCLPSPAVVRRVADGLLIHLAPGSMWIDMSTNDRETVLHSGERAALAGIRMLEAPVTGGVHKAAEGDITVLVGGDEDLYLEHRDLLAAVGSPVLYMGPLGSAAVIKVITNMLAFIHLVAAGEALMLAKRGGLDLTKSFEAILHSSGNSFVHETESQVILGFATGFGREFGVPLDLASMVEQTFIRAKAQYGGDAWSSQVVKLLEDALGTDLRAPGFPEKLQ